MENALNVLKEGKFKSFFKDKIDFSDSRFSSKIRIDSSIGMGSIEE